MAVIYGVLRARLDRWKREDPPAGAAKSPHLQVRVLDAQGRPWRIPVNVRSGDPAKSLVIFHKSDPLLSHPILDHVGSIPSGLTDLNTLARSASNALDYSRAPLFDITAGLALPPTGPDGNDDLQDIVGGYLTALKAVGGEVIAFGSHFHDQAPTLAIDKEFGTRDGMHDIHMNQGNAAGDHSDDNGVFNDGGLLLVFPDHVTGLFFRFKTQFLPTDAKGNRIPGVSREIPPASATAPAPSPAPAPEPTPAPAPAPGPAGGDVQPAAPVAYIERALLNPAGDDPGREAVVVGNTTTASLSLKGWRLQDQNGNADPLGIALAPGASAVVTLTGKGAQLGNKGGTLRLLNPDGVLIHAVTWSKADAVEARFVRFNT